MVFFLGPKDTILHPVSESSVDGFVKDEQPRHYTHVSEGSSSGSSSRSQSPDIWKPPSTGSGSSPDSNNRKSSQEKADATTTTSEEKDSGLNGNIILQISCFKNLFLLNP